VYAHICNPATYSNQPLAHRKCRGDADRFDYRIKSLSLGEVHQFLLNIAVGRIDSGVGAKLAGRFKTRLSRSTTTISDGV
jgi:hypothetical protein